MKNFCLYILLSFLFFSCRSEDYLKDFYVTLSPDEEVRVYKYMSKEDPSVIEYAKVNSPVNSTNIETTWFDKNLNKKLAYEETITEVGSELMKYVIFQRDDSGNNKMVIGSVEEKDLFKWDGTTKYSMAVTVNSENNPYDIKKIRSIIGFEHISIAGVDYRTAKFSDHITIQSKHDKTLEKFYQESFFVPQLGMIKYLKKVPEKDKLIELELVEILSLKDFETLKAAKNFSVAQF